MQDPKYDELPSEVKEALEVSRLVIKGQPRSHVGAASTLAKALQTLAVEWGRQRSWKNGWKERALEASASLARLTPVVPGGDQ